MTPRSRLLAIVAATALVAACDRHDPLGPEDISGTWVQGSPRDVRLPEPETLVINKRGGGRIKTHRWLDPLTPGGEYRPVWASGPVEYEIGRDDVFLRWCVQVPEQPPVSCTFDGYGTAGSLRKDGTLWIGPTSMVSSLAWMPWDRVSRDTD